MTNLKRVLLAVAMLFIISFGALANDQKKEKPPDKQSAPKVVNATKKDKPPSNSNQQGDQKKGDDKKGKP
jgi:hypothetical protein